MKMMERKAYTAFGETGYSQMQMVTAHCPTVQRDPASAPVVREFCRGWKSFNVDYVTEHIWILRERFFRRVRDFAVSL